MAKTIHIYTDASSKDTTMFPQGYKRTTKVGIIVSDSHIIDIYYNRSKKYVNSYYAERDAIKESIKYTRKKYNATNIIVYTDAYYQLSNNKTINNLIKEGIKILYVRGHKPLRKGWKYKFNCLADWISRNGIKRNWRNYYYRHLLGWKTFSF